MPESIIYSRLKRLVRPQIVGPLFLFADALMKIFHWEEFFRIVPEKLKEYRVFDFVGSPRVLIIIVALWLTTLIIWPEIRRRLPQAEFRSDHMVLRTWIDVRERNDVLFSRLARCNSGDVVRFTSFTARSVMLPTQPAGRRLIDNPFPSAVHRGVEFQGLLLDPEGTEAIFRSGIESPDIPTSERLLQRDSHKVASLLKIYREAEIFFNPNKLQLYYTSVGIPFSLWLFDDIAVVEPYHVGKRKGVGNLCEFAQLIIPRNDVSYQLVENHFTNLWEFGRARPVWPESSVQSSIAKSV